MSPSDMCINYQIKVPGLLPKLHFAPQSQTSCLIRVGCVQVWVHQMVFTTMVVGINTLDLFNSTNQIQVQANQSTMKWVFKICSTKMQVTPSLFKTLTNFNLLEFEDLFVLVVPTVQAHAKTINETHIVLRQSTKLTPNQCLLKFILYMKHDNVVMYDAFMWNQSKCIICNDAIFITSYINEVICDKV